MEGTGFSCGEWVNVEMWGWVKVEMWPVGKKWKCHEFFAPPSILFPPYFSWTFASILKGSKNKYRKKPFWVTNNVMFCIQVIPNGVFATEYYG